MVQTWSNETGDLDGAIGDIIQDLKVILYPQWGVIEGLKAI